MTGPNAPAKEKEAKAALSMRGMCKRFGATVALDGVDLTVRPGEVLALVGENGAGKSTLMKTLSGAIRADSGSMRLRDQPYQPNDPLHARKLGVSMIYQELSLAPHLSVMENILLGMEPTRGPLLRWRELKAAARHALDEVGLSHIQPSTRVSRLSVAEQQLVEIARAVAVGCDVLVLDEPTSSLTQHDTQRLFGLIRGMREAGRAIIYISHFLEEVQAVADRFTVLRDGRTVGTGTVADTPVHDIIRLMVGREVSELYPRSHRTPGDVVLTLDALGGSRYPKEASLELRRGEVLGIAGLMGAGRTETMRAVFGLDAVRNGSVRISGISNSTKPVTRQSPAQRWRQGLGMVSEDRKNEGLALNLSIADNLTLPPHAGARWWMSPTRQARASQRWIDRIPIRCRDPHQPVQALSGGNQQKVAIARLLEAEVDVLLLDEPTRGIDVASKAEVYRLIDGLAKGDLAAGREPRAVLMISSYLPELLGVCDRIAVMCRGVLGQARPVADWDEHKLMLEATGQEAVA